MVSFNLLGCLEKCWLSVVICFQLEEKMDALKNKDAQINELESLCDDVSKAKSNTDLRWVFFSIQQKRKITVLERDLESAEDRHDNMKE